MTGIGESGDMSGATVDLWKERLPHILEGYSARHQESRDETGCFWRALPGKKCKQWMTVAFIVNAAGENEAVPFILYSIITFVQTQKGYSRSKI